MYRGLLRIACLGLLVSAPLSSAAHADIYTYVDENGVLNFTNTYPTGKKHRRILGDEKRTAAIRQYRAAVYRTSSWDAHIWAVAGKYAVEPALVKAIIHAESNFNPFAVSPKGAEGLMQLMPATANLVDVADSFNPQDNIEGGVRYFRYLLDKYRGNIRLSLAAYNAGETNVDRYDGIPPFKETQEYVRRVMAHYQGYSDTR